MSEFDRKMPYKEPWQNYRRGLSIFHAVRQTISATRLAIVLLNIIRLVKPRANVNP